MGDCKKAESPPISGWVLAQKPVSHPDCSYRLLSNISIKWRIRERGKRAISAWRGYRKADDRALASTSCVLQQHLCARHLYMKMGCRSLRQVCARRAILLHQHASQLVLCQHTRLHGGPSCLIILHCFRHFSRSVQV